MIQKYSHIIELYACILYVLYYIFLSHEFLNFFWKMLNSKIIKMNYVNFIHMQSYSMSSYWFIRIKIHYIFPILYFKWIISWKKTIKFRFILIIRSYFKICQRSRRNQKSWPVVIVISSVLIVPLPANRFPNKLAPKVPNNILKNPPFYSFASFLNVSLMPCIDEPESLKDLTTFITSFISSFDIINVVTPEVFMNSCICCWCCCC